MSGAKELCTFRFDYDPGTLAPRGRRCRRKAVAVIKWKDGRESSVCELHGVDALTDETRKLVAGCSLLQDTRLRQIAFREAAALLDSDMSKADLDCEAYLSEQESEFVREYIRREIVALLKANGGAR